MCYVLAIADHGVPIRQYIARIASFGDVQDPKLHSEMEKPVSCFDNPNSMNVWATLTPDRHNVHSIMLSWSYEAELAVFNAALNHIANCIEGIGDDHILRKNWQKKSLEVAKAFQRVQSILSTSKACGSETEARLYRTTKSSVWVSESNPVPPSDVADHLNLDCFKNLELPHWYQELMGVKNQIFMIGQVKLDSLCGKVKKQLSIVETKPDIDSLHDSENVVLSRASTKEAEKAIDAMWIRRDIMPVKDKVMQPETEAADSPGSP